MIREIHPAPLRSDRHRAFAVVAILNGLLLLLDKTPAMRWLPARLTGGGFVEDIQQRIAGATEAYRNGSVAGDKYLGVLVGISDCAKPRI